MRSEKEVYDIVLNFAKTDKRIRMVTLEGSRTNTNIPPDDFQDFDITFFVTDMDSFTSDDKWLDIFGERLILQKPEDMELFPAVEKGFSYLMLFTDDVKIDLTLLPLELIDEYFTWDKLVKLLLDKDNRIVKPPIPTDIDYHLQKPTQRMFDDCCNEFWNTTTYVVKGLCRKEILFAIDHMNDIVRKELLRMISWLIGIKQGFHFSLGKNYKFMKQYVPEELWERLMSTYNMDSYPHMWESFEQCMALFREVSSEVACQLDYQYPLYDEKISNYVFRQKKKYGIVTTGSEVFKGRIKDTFSPVIREKLAEFPSEEIDQIYVDDEKEHILEAIQKQIAAGAELIICTGGMSVDPDDCTPWAIMSTGARVVSYGAPVLPGAMMLVSYYTNEADGRVIPILGLPGCVMYAKRTIFDLVLPRIMAGDEITAEDIAKLGEGGLCLNCNVCTFPNCGFGK